jgi:hypothetical protein
MSANKVLNKIDAASPAALLLAIIAAFKRA